MAKILIVDDQRCFPELLSKELILEGHRVRSVGDAESVREHLQLLLSGLVLLDFCFTNNLIRIPEYQVLEGKDETYEKAQEVHRQTSDCQGV